MPERGRRIDLHVGQQIRRRRELLGLSVQHLAQVAGLSVEDIDRYERGEVRVPSEALLTLAQCLAVAVRYFFEGLSEGIDVLACSGVAPAPPAGTDAQAQEAAGEALELVRAFDRIRRSPARRETLELLTTLEDILRTVATARQ